MSQSTPSVTSLSELLSPTALKMLTTSGTELVQQIGMDVVRGIVLDVLCGKNLRDSTEVLTRRRVVTLNMAMVQLFMQGNSKSNEFIAQLPYLAEQRLTSGKLHRPERWLAQWMLGLTDKAVQNVLRDDPQALAKYRDKYIQSCSDAIAQVTSDYGKLYGQLNLEAGVKAEVDWLFLTYLMNAIGAQTLTIRGSEKSAYGKLFERLILGSLLSILGFEYVIPPPSQFHEVFWLSSQEDKRESDATLLYELGKGARFDIGFIGRGNPEISLDKVSRFEREIDFGRSRFFMATIVLVDRIGSKSRIQTLAEAIQGTIIQMSASFWPQEVARVLHHTFGFEHPLVNMPQSDIENYLRNSLSSIVLEEFIGISEVGTGTVIKEDSAQYVLGDWEEDDL